MGVLEGVVFILTMSVLAFILYMVQSKLESVVEQRDQFYLFILKEHQRLHGCKGGLGLNLDTGEVQHFSHEG